MKRIIRLFLVLSLLSLLSGCAYYSKMAVPGEPAQQGKYEILKHIKTSVTGTRFLTIPINIPSSAQIIKNEVSLVGGDGIINTEITFSEFNFWLFSFPVVEVEGDIVKVVGETSSTSISSKAVFSDSLSNKKPVHTDAQLADELESWKKEILTYKDLQLKLKWKSFAKRNSIDIPWEEWVKSLPRSEYENYLRTNLKIRKWLGEKLDKGKEAEQVSQIDSEEFIKWKNKMLQNLTYVYNKQWSSYAKRNSITISLEDWVISLPESEYQQYLSSGESFDKWLQKKLKE